jgi:hypothetical protein
MDKEVLKRRLTERFQQLLAEALAAVEAAPDGQWIAASEWQVRDVFQKLTAECYQEMVQGRIEAEPSASRAAFSPGGRAGGGAAEQGAARGAGADSRR